VLFVEGQLPKAVGERGCHLGDAVRRAVADPKSKSANVTFEEEALDEIWLFLI
jgi:hypothetical protein